MKRKKAEQNRWSFYFQVLSDTAESQGAFVTYFLYLLLSQIQNTAKRDF